MHVSLNLNEIKCVEYGNNINNMELMQHQTAPTLNRQCVYMVALSSDVVDRAYPTRPLEGRKSVFQKS